jgi:hypothetical protein
MSARLWQEEVAQVLGPRHDLVVPERHGEQMNRSTYKMHAHLRCCLECTGSAGLVRLAKRQVVLSLPAPHALNAVEVSAPATGATARLDVRAAYAPYCKKPVGTIDTAPARASSGLTDPIIANRIS